MRRQIVDYVKCIETHYMDIVQKLKLKVKKAEKDAVKKVGFAAYKHDKKSELEGVLIEAIDKTRLQIFRRRLAQESLQR